MVLPDNLEATMEEADELRSKTLIKCLKEIHTLTLRRKDSTFVESDYADFGDTVFTWADLIAKELGWTHTRIEAFGIYVYMRWMTEYISEENPIDWDDVLTIKWGSDIDDVFGCLALAMWSSARAEVLKRLDDMEEDTF